ncbi:MAG: DUF2807 domain-containing protein [Bacteroidales bacterium]|nr:DUF2807 domain-containing protein [Bacteroidales bacterium]MCM1147937.1 DUF2807 domain-containing protein [Bacteroidales bacterium]MCM1205486.1 DUF2807 domain-containing protein [Bacillota bacterium]MCM1509252.1 DUF2807 domain-containing protein [Clostridium sp.]
MDKNIFLILLALTFSTYRCNAGNISEYKKVTSDKTIIKEIRDVKNFNAVTIIGNYNIVYTQGNTYKVEVEAPHNIMEKITTIVKDGTLTISPKKIAGVKVISNTKNEGEVTITVTSPTLTKAVLMGSGDFISNNTVEGKHLQIIILGSGNMVFQEISYNNITATVNGNGDLMLHKITASRSANIMLNGSGDFSIGQLSTSSASISLNGSGDMNIKNLESRIANLKSNGSGDLKLSAIKAQQVIAAMHGSGDTSIHLIRCENLNCKTIGSGEMNISGTTNIYMKSEVSRGKIRDNKLEYNKLFNIKTHVNQQKPVVPISPVPIEAQP